MPKLTYDEFVSEYKKGISTDRQNLLESLNVKLKLGYLFEKDLMLFIEDLARKSTGPFKEKVDRVLKFMRTNPKKMFSISKPKLVLELFKTISLDQQANYLKGLKDFVYDSKAKELTNRKLSLDLIMQISDFVLDPELNGAIRTSAAQVIAFATRSGTNSIELAKKLLLALEVGDIYSQQIIFSATKAVIENGNYSLNDIERLEKIVRTSKEISGKLKLALRESFLKTRTMNRQKAVTRERLLELQRAKGVKVEVIRSRPKREIVTPRPRNKTL